MNSIKSIFQGDASLIFTYWIIGVLGNLIISFIALTFEYIGLKYSESAVFLAFSLMFFVFSLFYLVFAIVAIWRSAGNYIADAKSENVITSSSPFWGYVARIMVSLAFLRFILVLVDEFNR